MQVVKHYTELIDQGRALEKEGEQLKAASLYEKAIKQEPLIELPYNRLMMIYRNQKEYKEELRVIEKGIALFKAHYDKKASPFTGNTTVARLSKALLQSVTGSDKRTALTNYPEPIPKWSLRKRLVEKKLS